MWSDSGFESLVCVNAINLVPDLDLNVCLNEHRTIIIQNTNPFGNRTYVQIFCFGDVELTLFQCEGVAPNFP